MHLLQALVPNAVMSRPSLGHLDSRLRHCLWTRQYRSHHCGWVRDEQERSGYHKPCRPWPINIGLGHHPDCGPQPIALGHLGNHFDSAIGDGLFPLGIQTSRPDGVDDGAGGFVTADGAIVYRLGRTCTSSCQVQHIPIIDLSRCDFRAVSGQSWNNVKAHVVDVGVLWVIRGPFERATSKASPLNLVVPCLLVDGLEVILEYQTVFEIGDRRIRQVAYEAPEEKSNANAAPKYDSLEFCLWVLFLSPRLLIHSIAQSSRLEFPSTTDWFVS